MLVSRRYCAPSQRADHDVETIRDSNPACVEAMEHGCASVVRGSDEGFGTCKVAGSLHPARLTTGSIWSNGNKHADGTAEDRTTEGSHQIIEFRLQRPTQQSHRDGARVQTFEPIRVNSCVGAFRTSPLYKRQSPTIFEHETVRPPKPFAPALLDAIDDFSHAPTTPPV